ncbi:MAG: S1C family serine protease [Terriglobia bacterium]
MRSLTIIRLLAPALICLCGGHAWAAEKKWELFATSKASKVYFDRGSVRQAEGYVQYDIRVEYGQTRETRDKKYRYRSEIRGQAVQCETSKFAVTSMTLLDEAGVRLAGSSRERERWEETLNEVEAGGVQARILQHACAIARGENPPKPDLKIGARPAGKTTIGAGIVATHDGMIITNHHVVDGCSAIFVLDSQKNRAPAERITSDSRTDLALIQASRTFPEVAAFRKGVQLQAGESVTVVGYPLASILGSEQNVTFGYVTATAGVRGDASTFLISAPIHKGNSGGPILDQSGNVTGIVTSKLNALAVQKRTGDLPQNISFGVKAEIAQTFLDALSVRYQSGAAGRKLENTEVAAIGKAITVLVACRKTPSATDDRKQNQ